MDQQLASCQREINRLRGLVRLYGGFFDEVEKVCDSFMKYKTPEEKIQAIEKLIKEYSE